jgi:oligopeptide/dipeptide ABC transporter ATP-binding protein
MSLLSIQGLRIHFKTDRGELRAVDGVSFDLGEGESLGLVGESGCGKTTLAKSLFRILPDNAVIAGGRILFRERDLFQAPLPEMRRIRWRDLSLISQSAMTALDPVYRVGAQIVEVIRAHESCSRDEAWNRARNLFEAVGLEVDRLRHYPHQFSGGMRQRAVIAMALALDPPLIVADEPTTALDVIMQDQVFEQITRLRQDGRQALILITHDISLVAENCDRIAVMYAGQIIEIGSTQAIFTQPMHPYTIGLQNAFPHLTGKNRELISIQGAPPDLTNPPAGCRFAPRCPFAQERCAREAPPLSHASGDHHVACLFPEKAADFREAGRHEKTWEQEESQQMAGLG